MYQRFGNNTINHLKRNSSSGFRQECRAFGSLGIRLMHPNRQSPVYTIDKV